VITSRDNERLRLVRRLASRDQRERLGLFVCEGEDLVAAGLDAGLAPVELLLDPERPALAGRVATAVEVEPRLLAGLSELGHPPRAIGLFRRADLLRLAARAAPPTGLALWRVGDPGNLGTIVRAADAFGPAFVCLSPGCADPTSVKALRASAGAIFRVALGDFDEAPGRTVALVPRGGTPLGEVELAPAVCFVLGAERDGLPRELVERCDAVATIAQAAGAESLNVAMAATVALYERARRLA
jgi:TrmH family RNA methyltransferase